MGALRFSRLKQIEKPVPNDNQLLVRVHAASVNPLDLTIRGSAPSPPVVWTAQTKRHSPGCRLCAERLKRLAKTSRSSNRATKYSAGKTGALAEYICVLADRAVVLKPANMTFEQAAVCPSGGNHRVARSSRQRKNPGRAKGFDQRRIRRCGHVRGADREIIRHRSHRRMQHAECRSCPINRRRPRD